MNLDTLFSRIHIGIRNANNLFTEWTGGQWLQDSGVEGFVVAQIASAIMDPQHADRPGFLTLETPFSMVYASSKEPRGRKGAAAKNRNRFDITLYHKNETVSHVIEVKRFRDPRCDSDLDRLCTVYKRCGKPSNGPRIQAIFVQLLNIGITGDESSLEYHIKNRFKTMEERCRDYIRTKHKLDCKFSKGTDHYEPILNSDKTRAFSSFCLSICHRPVTTL